MEVAPHQLATLLELAIRSAVRDPNQQQALMEVAEAADRSGAEVFCQYAERVTASWLYRECRKCAEPLPISLDIDLCPWHAIACLEAE